MDSSVCVWDAATGACGCVALPWCSAQLLRLNPSVCSCPSLRSCSSLRCPGAVAGVKSCCCPSLRAGLRAVHSVHHRHADAPARPPVTLHAGTPTGLFVGDCGFTCCWYDSSLEQLAVGTDRGIVHALDLGLVPRCMPGAALASAAAKAAAHPTAAAHAHPHPPMPHDWLPGQHLPLQALEQAAASAAAGANGLLAGVQPAAPQAAGPSAAPAAVVATHAPVAEPPAAGPQQGSLPAPKRAVAT